ncbi:protein-lysine N-methyltransferase EEF2KMT [Eublepharis macularius]|uniref:Protein-lysine N-methyltransferase EEF2KMT n=1 Tax=Eublepharis macularius TaxID=481883 RepID=A0AA97K0W9_EUBMA|nr:protein-lysine N-methyltransferase EEF2KMT [Eublepharis macularius]XP_054848864.1 protein-lysine N-methyltransferase EEF2KMT [Eublepharis macularius]
MAEKQLVEDVEQKEEEATAEQLGLLFQRTFLAGRRLALLPWKDLEQALQNSKDSSLLLAILQKTVLHPLCLKYPPSVKYRRHFLSELIKKHECTAAEPLDQLYEALGDVLNAENSTCCYRSYILPSGDAVTVRENVAIISQGTTGLVTWDGGLYLAEWALEHPLVFTNRSILELGSGIGLTGIAICKTCHPRTYTFSDHHPCVLEELSENIRLNGFFLQSGHYNVGRCAMLAKCADHEAELAELQGPSVTVAELDWDSVTKEQLAVFQADVIIAADVVYDPNLTLSLVAVLRKLPVCNNAGNLPEIYIASTCRNSQTFCHFQRVLEHVGIRWEAVPGPQKNFFPYDQNTKIMILKLLL